MNVVIIGPTLTGNKGAAAMVESSIELLYDKYGSDFNAVLLSYYYQEDLKNNHLSEYLTIEKANPIYLALIINSLCLLLYLFPFLKSIVSRCNKSVRSIMNADIYLDQGGITFSDGREKFLIFNIATILPGILLKKRIIKCAQAMGPFNNLINRKLAKLLLPKIDTIIARGEETYGYLEGLGLKNIVRGADIAFALDHSIKFNKDISILNFDNSFTYIGFCPSIVVKKQCVKSNINYVEIVVEFINWLVEVRGYRVLLIPHSIRIGTRKLHNNDLPLSIDIYNRIRDKSKIYFIQEELTASMLRYLIGNCKLFIASRFHSMVSSLASCTPTLVVGWSHKYEEVLNMFDLEKYVIDHKSLNLDTLKNLFYKLEQNQVSIREKISKHLVEVEALARSHVNYF